MDDQSFLLAIQLDRPCGLIICGAHHAELAGPGAVVYSPVEQGYASTIAIGSPRLVPVKGVEARVAAFRRRIDWLRWQQRITRHDSPMVRATLLLQGLDGLFGSHVTAQVPTAPLARLAGVLEDTMDRARDLHGQPSARIASILGTASASTLWVDVPANGVRRPRAIARTAQVGGHGRGGALPSVLDGWDDVDRDWPA